MTASVLGDLRERQRFRFTTWPELVPAQLTDGEREVLALVGTGLSDEEIAAQLVLSPATARTHVSRIMTKLAARDRAQLVIATYESGLVQPRHH